MSILSYIFLQSTPAASKGGLPINIILMVAMFAVFYFFMIRPQSKKAKEQKDFIANLKKGDKVVTAGGIHGKIVQVDEDGGTVLVQVDDNTKLRIEKGMVSVEMTKAVQVS